MRCNRWTDIDTSAKVVNQWFLDGPQAFKDALGDEKWQDNESLEKSWQIAKTLKYLMKLDKVGPFITPVHGYYKV